MTTDPRAAGAPPPQDKVKQQAFLARVCHKCGFRFDDALHDPEETLLHDHKFVEAPAPEPSPQEQDERLWDVHCSFCGDVSRAWKRPELAVFELKDHIAYHVQGITIDAHVPSAPPPPLSQQNTQRWKERAETALEQLEASERRATQWGKENVRLQDELQRAKEMLTEAERQRHFWSRESLRHETQVAALQEALQEHHDAVAMASWTGGSAADTWGRPCPVCGRVLSGVSQSVKRCPTCNAAQDEMHALDCPRPQETPKAVPVATEEALDEFLVHVHSGKPRAVLLDWLKQREAAVSEASALAGASHKGETE